MSLRSHLYIARMKARGDGKKDVPLVLVIESDCYIISDMK